MTTKKPHHHGNLRAALIQAGLDLIQSEGPDALSIRKVAAMAGVSHAAPAHHFPSLAHLRTAVVAEGYRRFTASMEAAIAEADGTPRDVVLAACLGYLRFAWAYSGVFSLMFGPNVHGHDDPDLRDASDAAYGVLVRICAPFAKDDAVQTELTVWSLVHGYASLAVAGNRRLVPGEAAEAVFRGMFAKLDLGAAEA